jgi:hypothetical protein
MLAPMVATARAVDALVESALQNVNDGALR